MSRVAADVTISARKDDRQQTCIQAIVWHLVNDTVGDEPGPVTGDVNFCVQSVQMPRPRFGNSRAVKGGQALGRTASRPVTVWMSSKVSRASRSSPAPWT